MLGKLAELATLATVRGALATDRVVVEACDVIRELLGAEDAYVLRAGDPHFVRVGCDCDPREYEIKQRGYWLSWRGLAGDPKQVAGLANIAERMVTDSVAFEAGLPATHLATILPNNESNSEMLVVRGPWPEGLTAEQVGLVCAMRPLMSYLVGNVLDSERQERVRTQLTALAEIAQAFSHAEGSSALTALCTALANASGFAWVTLYLYDPRSGLVVERAANVSRHSNTETARSALRGEESPTSAERNKRVTRQLLATRMPIFVPDVADPAENVMLDDDLRRYYERAHVVSLACFPVFIQDELRATITFSGNEPHDYGVTEVAFLQALVSQATNTLRAMGLSRELQQAEQQLRAVVSNAPVFLTVLDPDGTVVFSEGAGLQKLTAQMGSMVGRSVFSLMPPNMQETFRESLRRGMAGEVFSTTVRMLDRDFQTQLAPLRGEAGDPVGVIAVTLDVTERRQAERELRALNRQLEVAKEKAETLAKSAEESRLRAEYLARHDDLTGMLSRRAWFEAATQNRPVAVAVFDIDYFKTINDRFGHPAGDAVLRTVAHRIREAIGQAGVVGRLGGEEFGVAFFVPMHEAEQAAARAVAAVGATPCEIDEETSLRTTVSAGIAPCRRATDSPAEALDRAYESADRALYEAKARGRHQLVISQAA